MVLKFHVTRAESAVDRSSSVIPDADKLLKKFEARYSDAQARLEEGDSENVEVVLTVADGVKESDVLRTFGDDAKTFGLALERTS